MKASIIILVASVLLTTSCVRKIKMNNALKFKLDEQHINYKHVQFYNSGLFILERNTYSEAMVASEGKLRMKNDKHVERLRFKNKTKASCDTIIGKIIFIRFEEGTGKQLAFTPNEKGLYELVETRSDSNGRYVTYGNQEYKLELSDGKVLLLAKRKKVRDADINRRRVKGVKVKG